MWCHIVLFHGKREPHLWFKKATCHNTHMCARNSQNITYVIAVAQLLPASVLYLSSKGISTALFVPHTRSHAAVFCLLPFPSLRFQTREVAFSGSLRQLQALFAKQPVGARGWRPKLDPANVERRRERRDEGICHEKVREIWVKRTLCVGRGGRCGVGKGGCWG